MSSSVYGCRMNGCILLSYNYFFYSQLHSNNSKEKRQFQDGFRARGFVLPSRLFVLHDETTYPMTNLDAQRNKRSKQGHRGIKAQTEKQTYRRAQSFYVKFCVNCRQKVSLENLELIVIRIEYCFLAFGRLRFQSLQVAFG